MKMASGIIMDPFKKKAINIVPNTDYIEVGGRSQSYICGGLIILALNFRPKQALSAEISLFTNLPEPYKGNTSGSVVGEGTDNLRLYITSAGALVTDGSGKSGIWYNGTIVYAIK